MGILAYWRHKDYLQNTVEGFNYHYDSHKERLHAISSVGEDLFLVSYAPAGEHKEYLLVAHLVIDFKRRNGASYPYGEYRLCGDRERSKYFSLDNPPLTPIFPELTSITHFEVKESYAQSFRLRKLSAHDTTVLLRFARQLTRHPDS